VRTRVDRIHAAGLEGDPDAQWPRLGSRERAIVITAAVAEPITPRVESEAGNQQAIGLHRPAARRYRDAELASAHRCIARPGVKTQHVVVHDRQGCNPSLVGIQPVCDGAAQIGFAPYWPVEADGTYVGLREPLGDMLTQSLFTFRAAGLLWKGGDDGDGNTRFIWFSVRDVSDSWHEANTKEQLGQLVRRSVQLGQGTR